MDLLDYRVRIVDTLTGVGRLYQVKVPLNLLTTIIPTHISSKLLRRRFPLFRDLNGELVVTDKFDKDTSVVSLDRFGRLYWITIPTKYLNECSDCKCNPETLLNYYCKCGVGSRNG